MRNLASVQKILDIQPIEGADAIEVATINGWKVVIAKKDNFKVGDLVIYCEVDSWLPHKLAPFLSKGQFPRVYDGIEGERLKTVKLRNTTSQGLILKIADAFKDRLVSVDGEMYINTSNHQIARTEENVNLQNNE